jgi:nitrogen fixation protein FixH
MLAIRFAQCRWIPWAIAGCFAVVIAVNLALTYFAVHSDTGLVTEHPYELGTGYNRVLDDAAVQAALGWQGELHFRAANHLGGTIDIDLRDRDGQPLSGLSVSARLVRPLGGVADAELATTELAPGRYAAPVSLAEPGQWEVRVAARRGTDVLRFEQRIVAR